MTHQRTTSRLAFIARPGALRVARAMAAVRLGIGAIGVLAPGRLAWRLFLPGRQADEATALALRAAAARDLALGLGTALASRRGPGPLRGWLLATALVDCCDALTNRQEQVSKRGRTYGDRAGLRPVRRRADSPRPADGVFSMDGDIGPLPALCALAVKYGAIMMVDDAHASGVLGKNGRGTIDHFKMHGRVDIQVGTLSKAIGALGGYVCGTRDLIDFLYHRARPFLFSTSHPPSVAATCIAAFDVLENEPERIEKLWRSTRFWKRELGLLGFDIGGRTTPASACSLLPSSSATANLPWIFPASYSRKACWAQALRFRRCPKARPASERS